MSVFPIRRVIAAATAAATAVAMSIAVSPAASAAVSADAPVVINEVYGGGGNSGATLTNDFVELYNAGAEPVDLSGWSVQYASASGTSWQVTELGGTLPAGSYYLINEAAGSGGSTTPAADTTGTIAMSASKGKVALVNSATALTCSSNCPQDTAVVDFVGFGTANEFAGTGAAPTPGDNSHSLARNDAHTNTADNAADFAVSTPSPTACGAACVPVPPEGGDKTVAEIQGTGGTSPLEGATVTTTGVVTAAYPTGGFNGYVIQTPGTGGDLDLATHQASDALFVFSSSTAGAVAIGDYVRVTGKVSEYKGLTELTVRSTDDLTKLNEAVVAPKPITNAWPTTDAQRESIESMLFAGSGNYTVTNTYSTNQYAEIGLAYGTEPLMQPTDVAAPGSAEAAAVAADNAARAVVLDDGASINFLSSSNSSIPLPYVSLTDPLRVGEQVTFTHDVIVDYRNDAWKLQPRSQVTADDPADYPATWTNNRAAGPDTAALGSGDLQVASFNVLNYFTTLGDTRADCTAYTDRDGNGITTKRCTEPNGPRGAWDAASFERQQTKIVHAINTLDASVIGLMEIENSLVVDGPGHADEALATLVAALNADAGSTKWAYVPSSTDLPPAAEMDVINNAIIYQVADVERLGESHALGALSASGQPFDNAREPIAQAFTPKTGGDPFTVVVNHFKSKGSAGPLPGDEDQGDGQGSSNASRKAQATALNAWVNDTLIPETGVRDVFMTGDYNSYTQEDPLRILYDAGWTDVNSHYQTGKQSYSYGGLNGSLDHVLANASALARTTGADIWNVNAPESVALEYSRYNYNVTIFYDEKPYRASDHDPVIVGFESGQAAPPPWDRHRIYRAGDEVSYHGSTWRAAWWAWHVKPGASPWGPWEEIATAPDGTAVWTPSRIFNRGDIVTYRGEKYEAKWWTRHQRPGTSWWGPWRPLS